MGPFAHLGLTAGAAVVVNSLCNRRGDSSADGSPGQRRGFWRPLGLGATIAVLFGSLLPDVIDKPIGNLIWADYFANGRIYAHTMLFLIIVSLAGLVLYLLKKNNWLLLVAFGVFTHLILDEMWLEPGRCGGRCWGWNSPTTATWTR
jgi:hypothetical protein